MGLPSPFFIYFRLFKQKLQFFAKAVDISFYQFAFLPIVGWTALYKMFKVKSDVDETIKV